MGDRKVGHNVKVRLMDRNFNHLPVLRVGDEDIGEVDKPENYEAMCDIAEKLSKEFPHARVDLYNLKGKILFGELTFYNASGYMIYNPDSFDYRAGDYFKLKKR